MLSNAPSLKVSGISKSFGGLKAVDNVSFEIQPGELLALIGPNGAGKSTCFNLINGQLKPDAGLVELGSVALTGKTVEQIFHCGLGRTFQIAATFSSMTVVENVQMALLSKQVHLNPRGNSLALNARRASTRSASLLSWFKPTSANSGLTAAREQHRDQALGLLDRVGMRDQADRATSVLAYGDIKRAELAIALANEPQLLLMDEPTAGMAPQERLSLMAITQEIARAQSIAVLFTEHSMDAVFTYADRVIVLARGQLIAQGSVEQVRNNPKVQEVYLGGGAKQ
jgi:branched-chain amino acid transport system ATP-binding protein